MRIGVYVTDNKENKIFSKTVRLPDDLLSELRKEVAPYFQRGEKPPKFGDLLWDAWRQARHGERIYTTEDLELLEKLAAMLQDPDVPEDEFETVRKALNRYTAKRNARSATKNRCRITE